MLEHREETHAQPRSAEEGTANWPALPQASMGLTSTGPNTGETLHSELKTGKSGS